MEKDKRKELLEKKRRCEKLGARKFQKVVFKVEKAKFKVLKRICPNFLNIYNKYLDHKQKQALRKATSEEQRQQIRRNIKFMKMAMKKQFNQEKNINYHQNQGKPTEMISYLEWNKEVHKKGIVKNAILIPALTAASIMGFVPAIPFLALEIIDMGINLECINLQDYNIARYRLIEDRLKKAEERRVQGNITSYGEAAKVIYDTVEEQEKLPTYTEIIGRMKTREQLEQFKELLLREKRERHIEDQKVKVGGI